MPRSDAELDHLVVTAHVLADGVTWVEAALGVKMQERPGLVAISDTPNGPRRL